MKRKISILLSLTLLFVMLFPSKVFAQEQNNLLTLVSSSSSTTLISEDAEKKVYERVVTQFYSSNTNDSTRGVGGYDSSLGVYAYINCSYTLYANGTCKINSVNGYYTNNDSTLTIRSQNVLVKQVSTSEATEDSRTFYPSGSSFSYSINMPTFNSYASMWGATYKIGISRNGGSVWYLEVRDQVDNWG